ncbi:MAG: ribosome recycling factor [Candidatus Margulisbacteria bacterium]|nr:ribosome recycling factor [Candidatus Margulisiibacteriota bacterium]
MAKAKERMEKSIANTKQKFSGIRTGRASPALLNNIMVEAYGSNMPLNQLATITVPESQMLVVSPFDPQNINAIEKGIMNSNLGLTPQNDGKIIRVPLPKLSEERRKELDKIVRQEAEEGRVAIRNIRRDLLDEIKKNKEYSEDDSKRIQDEIQKVTDKNTAQIDELLENKIKEIKEI